MTKSRSTAVFPMTYVVVAVWTVVVLIVGSAHRETLVAQALASQQRPEPAPVTPPAPVLPALDVRPEVIEATPERVRPVVQTLTPEHLTKALARSRRGVRKCVEEEQVVELKLTIGADGVLQGFTSPQIGVSQWDCVWRALQKAHFPRSKATREYSYALQLGHSSSRKAPVVSEENFE